MSLERRILWWAAGTVLVLVGLYFVREVLLPFVVGFALAYLLDPAADRIERWGAPRWLAATLIVVASGLVFIAALLVLGPVVQAQILSFIDNVPRYIGLLRDQAMALADLLRSRLSPEELQAVRSKIAGLASPGALSWVGAALGELWGGGVALFNLLSLLFITPVVAFYLLRDWDRIIVKIDSLLPRRHAPIVRAQMRAIDHVLSGCIRGQLTVCLLLGVFYAVGLSLTGLEFGLIIGLVTGLLSFIPIFGMLLGFAVGVGVALVQFGFAFRVVLIIAVFVAGWALEGNIVTPRLVGSRIGLHPVWAIFALLAGGAVAGFVGLLLAMPAAAVIGVLVRFSLDRYLHGPAYRGDASGTGGAGRT